MKRCSVITLAAVLLAVTTQAISAGAQAAGAPPSPGDQSRRDDAMVLMSAAVLVPGIAAYCDRQPAPNAAIAAAATGWHKRNEAIMQRILEVLQSEGGLSRQAMAMIDRLGTALLLSEVEQRGGPESYCRAMADEINGGQIDLDKMAELEAPLARIMTE